MKFTFYKNSSDERKVNKNLSLQVSCTGTVKEDVSILTPTLVVKYDEKLLACNYVNVPAFGVVDEDTGRNGRYYYITDITAAANMLYISCRVDVLMTYKELIYGTSAFVARSEGKRSNMMINDSIFLCQNNPVVDIKMLSPNKSFDPAGDFVLAIAGH